VDHEARRRQVIAVASALIAESGLDAVSVRDIALAADCSTAIVSHYFHNKRELLLLTYRSSIERATERSEAALAASQGRLKAYLTEIMPLDDERKGEWKIWIAFWAKALGDREIAEMQRDCVRRTRDNILAVMNRLEARGVLRAGTNPERESRRLLTLIIGMAVQVLFDGEDWPSERQHTVIDAALADLHRAGRTAASVDGAHGRSSDRLGVASEE
jgi:AcrR family transcriptional regulator